MLSCNHVACWDAAQCQNPAGWRPIATAPKDGTKILVTEIGFGRDATNCAFWRDDAGEWWSVPSGRVYRNLTHWMPLPNPPKEGSSK